MRLDARILNTSNTCTRLRVHAVYDGNAMRSFFDTLDAAIARFMRRQGYVAIRIALGVVFIWFGVLKPMGISAAEPLVLATVDWMPLFSPHTWLHIIGWWEVAIGVCFLFQRTLRIAIALMFLQMIGTFMPLFMLPEVTFQDGRLPYAPTMEGQYIIKNIVLIAAALVVGGTVRKREHASRSRKR